MEKHESQKDYSKGFGGKFGLQTDRQDSTAVGFDEDQGPVGTSYEKDKPIVAEKGKASQLKSRFENLADENKKAAEKSPQKSTTRPATVNKIAHKFEPAPAPSVAAPAPQRISQPPPVKKEEPPAPVVVQAPPSPVPAPVIQSSSISERLNLAQTVEEVDDAAWKDKADEDAWKEEEEEATDVYAQENPNLESAQLEEIGGSGYVAVALYDYQASADDELSFDPDDIITNIEMVRLPIYFFSFLNLFYI